MFTRHVPIVLFASFLAFAGCAAQTQHDDQEDPSTFTAATENALSSFGKQLVGDYKSDAVYPRFSLLKDGSYTWDTGIRCVKAPCPSGDSGKFSIWNDSRGRKYVNLFASDHSVSRWFRVDGTKPVVLVGVAGVSGTFKMIVATPTPGCTVSSDCAGGEQCISGTCTARPLCVQVTSADGVFHAKNFPAGGYADANAWAAATAPGLGYGISVYTCADTAAGYDCGGASDATCAFVSGTEAAKTYGSECEAKRAVMATADTGGEALGVLGKGACVSDGPYCSTFHRTSEGTTSFAYYAHTFGSKFESNAWILLNPGASDALAFSGKCSDSLICPMIYKPVCGGVKSDPAKTFGNQCELEAAVRADSATDGWSKGYGQPGACK